MRRVPVCSRPSLPPLLATHALMAGRQPGDLQRNHGLQRDYDRRGPGFPKVGGSRLPSIDIEGEQ